MQHDFKAGLKFAGLTALLVLVAGFGMLSLKMVDLNRSNAQMESSGDEGGTPDYEESLPDCTCTTFGDNNRCSNESKCISGVVDGTGLKCQPVKKCTFFHGWIGIDCDGLCR